ncbi:hypothetical protein HU200_057784 [Digitaria exilis]|uniref:Uncharacterized protein n=1 Tax=Digitaria exilis TaxID=1010633 RepID=A0A835E108_9POAL|nr:hypothetical protein HU200_057784 [Digitaria exilis]
MTNEINEYWLLCERRNTVTDIFSIQRIPRHLLEVNRNAYEPIIMSVGPYHYGTKTLLSMEKEKLNCLDFMLKLNHRIARCLESILHHYPIANEPVANMQFHHLLHWCHICFRPSQITEHRQQQIRFRYFHHLLHFGKKYLGPASKSGEDQQRMLPIQQMDCFQAEHLPNRWRRAVQYHEEGVRLNKREHDPHKRYSLLDIKFSNGEVGIPILPIDENTESLLKNLIALEQTDLRSGNDITAYIRFMSQLVSTPDDATLLSEKGIIVHLMDSDEEIAALFTRLIQQVTINADGDYYLKSLCHELEAHYQSRLNRWIAWLWLNHFSNPWLAMAVLAAAVVLICTIVQTIYTVLAYLKPPA